MFPRIDLFAGNELNNFGNIFGGYGVTNISVLCRKEMQMDNGKWKTIANGKPARVYSYDPFS